MKPYVVKLGDRWAYGCPEHGLCTGFTWNQAKALALWHAWQRHG